MKSTGIAIVLTEIEHRAYINLNSKITKFGCIEMSEAIGVINLVNNMIMM